MDRDGHVLFVPFHPVLYDGVRGERRARECGSDTSVATDGARAVRCGHAVAPDAGLGKRTGHRCARNGGSRLVFDRDGRFRYPYVRIGAENAGVEDAGNAHGGECWCRGARIPDLEVVRRGLDEVHTGADVFRADQVVRTSGVKQVRGCVIFDQRAGTPP